MKKILIAAITLNGKIAKNKNHNVTWTSKKDKIFFRSQCKKAGVVVFGSRTYKTIGRPMPGCLNIVMTREPKKYQNKAKKQILKFTNDSPKTILDKLAQQGYNKVIIGGGQGIYSLFLKKGLVNEIYLTIAPKIFGKGIGIFEETVLPKTNLKLIQTKKLGPSEILLKYKTKN